MHITSSLIIIDITQFLFLRKYNFSWILKKKKHKLKQTTINIDVKQTKKYKKKPKS